ncbi:MAG: zinc finger domain-containing protein, partial [Stellaceae bacterium]
PDTSVHLETYLEVPTAWRDPASAGKFAQLRDVRRVVTGALELERAEKRLGASLQAAVTVYADESYRAAIADSDLAELAIVSAATLHYGAVPAGAFTLPEVPGVAVTVALAPGEKCQRCWRVLPEVGHVHGHDDLCRRCAEMVDAAAAPSLA